MINQECEPKEDIWINSYLVSKIQNADKSETLDKSILKIKANSDSNYKTFTDLTTLL